MESFEIRYNAVERASLFMIQRLIVETAKLQGPSGRRWVEEFRNAVVTELNEAQSTQGLPPPREITALAQRIVINIAEMAKDRYVEN